MKAKYGKISYGYGLRKLYSKIAIIIKAIYRINTIPIKVLVMFFMEMGKIL